MQKPNEFSDFITCLQNPNDSPLSNFSLYFPETVNNNDIHFETRKTQKNREDLTFLENHAIKYESPKMNRNQLEIEDTFRLKFKRKGRIRIRRVNIRRN